MNRTGIMPMLRWILPLLVFMALLAFAVNWWAEASRGALPVLGDVPSFDLVDQNGNSFTRADLNGKINIVEFFFTSCRSVCPVMNGNMAELYYSLHGTDMVRIVSISVDPERDSLPALRAYADSVGVNDNRWIFLRGSMEAVTRLCEKGFMLPAQGLPMGHTTRFTLVDSRGRIRGYYDGMNRDNVARLREDLRLLADDRQ